MPEPKDIVWLKSNFGVRVEVENGQTRQLVIDALKVMQAKGFDFPKVIRDDVEFFRRYQASNSPAAYLKNVLHLNPQHEIWANPTQYARVQFEKKFWSSNQPGAVVWHESGHYLHEKQAINIYRKYALGGFADENDGMIAKTVSDYAIELFPNRIRKARSSTIQHK